MCYIANKIEYNGCGKIISEVVDESLKTMLEWVAALSNRMSSALSGGGVWELDGFEWVSQYVRITCVCVVGTRCAMTVTPTTDRQTNKHHPHSNLLHKTNDRAKKMRLRNHNSQSKCLCDCLHSSPVVAGCDDTGSIRIAFNGIFISTYKFDAMLLFFNVFAAIASFHLSSALPILRGRYIIISVGFFFSLGVCHWFRLRGYAL